MPTCIFVVNEKQTKKQNDFNRCSGAQPRIFAEHVKGTFRQENVLKSIKNNTKPCIALKENIYAIIRCV